MTRTELNRMLGFRFWEYGDAYWCLSVDEEKGYVFMSIFDNTISMKKKPRRMATVAEYILKQFKQVKAVVFPRTTFTRKEKQISITPKNQTTMCIEKKTGTWFQVVKETVDSVYEYLIPHAEGITMSAKEYGKRGARVCTKLVDRGIVEKKALGKGRGWRYKWVATMAPTKVLYGSIAQELYDEQRKYNETFKQKGKQHPVEENVEKPSEIEAIHGDIIMKCLVGQCGIDLNKVPIMDMWENMKKRGVSIKDGRLVLTETKVVETILD